MSNNNYTHAVFLIDKSSSMSGEKATAAMKSINQFIEDQVTGEGVMTVSLYDFAAGTPYNHHNYQFQNTLGGGIYRQERVWNPSYKQHPLTHIYGPVDVSVAPNYKLVPNGGTALMDAMAECIDQTGKWLASLNEDKRPSKLIFITITDGEENSSMLVNAEQLKTKVSHQTEVYNWEFLFMGAGLDAFEVGRMYGITNAVQFANTAASYSAATEGLSSALLTTRATGMSYTNSVRKAGNVYDEKGNAKTVDNSEAT